jgi:hypothetical protein
MSDHPAPADKSPWLVLLRHWRMIESQAVWFIVANLLDCAFTFSLLITGGQRGLRYVEGNRIPAYFFNHWGWKGLFGFKLVVVVFVCLIALAIAHKRPATARGLLGAGTLLVMLVVLYSTWLYIH